MAVTRSFCRALGMGPLRANRARMDAIELLIEQHDELDDLFEQIEEADEEDEKA